VSIDKDQIRLEGPTISNGMKIDWEPNDRYWVLRYANKAFVAATKPFEITDLETAVARYREALLKLKEYEEISRRFLRSPGLRGEYEKIPMRGEVAILNRLNKAQSQY
jgi:hypothetical protein